MNSKLICFLLIIFLIGNFNDSQGQNYYHIKHYTTDDGLPHNVGYGLRQDSKGFLWVCTDDGLARFDGKNFKIYRSKDGLLSNYPMDVAEDQDGTLWIGSWKGGVNYLKNDSLYTPKLDNPLFRVANIYIRGDQLLFSDRAYEIAFYQKKGDEWKTSHIRRQDKLFVKKDSSLVYANLPDDTPAMLKRLLVFQVYLASDQSRLVFGNMAQVWKHKDNSSEFTPFFPDIIQKDTIFHISQDAQKSYWLGGRGKILKIDSLGRSRKWTKNLPPYRIHSIEHGIDGKIYFLAGWNNLNNRGLYAYDPVTQQLEDLMQKYNFQDFPSEMEIDREGNLWFTTNGDGLYCITYSRFKNYNQKQGLKGDFVRQIIQDKQGAIYAGTLSGLYKYQSSGFSHIPLLQREASIQVNGLYFDVNQNLMVVVDDQTRTNQYLFEIMQDSPPKLIESRAAAGKQFTDLKNKQWFYDGNGLAALISGKEGQVSTNVRGYKFATDFLVHQLFTLEGKNWMATNHGLYAFEENLQGAQPKILFLDSLKVADGLPSNFVNAVVQGPNQELWIGTKEGLCLYQDGKMQQLTTKDGLISDNCTSLLIDHHNGLWVGTSKGLSYFDGQSFVSYNHKTGLISPSINCLFLDDRKRLWIGTSNGISVLDILKVPEKATSPRFYMEPLLVDRKPVKTTSAVTIRYNQRLDVQFQALTLIHPEGVRYQYRMDGEPWQETSRNFLNYNRILAGTHLLEIRAKKYNSNWSVIQRIQIKVTPPFWLTWWAFALYGIALILVMYGVIRWRSQKLIKDKLRLEQIVAKRTQVLEQQKEEIVSQAEKLKEMDQVKSRFFSNISHEFKTPLTLIIGPAEKLLGVKKMSLVKTYSQYILANAHRLMKLINQLMDVSKIESGKMELNLSTGNLATFLSQIFHSFELLAQQKDIQMELQVSEPDIVGDFDEDKLEKIFFNLLSNALKFTPAKGKVTFSLEALEEQVKVTVTDTGMGIPPQQLSSVFERFYQADDSGTRAHEGTGIGLALVKELVDLHEGTINVVSEADQGTTFTVELPFVRKSNAVEAKDFSGNRFAPGFNTLISEESPVNEETSLERNTFLIVEDNVEIQTFIATELSPFYEILLANNGQEGMSLALQKVPDLIISDVMMPKVDGFEMVKMLRANEATSHIPIVILSAKSSFESKITGLEIGGDDYLTKPFSVKELLLRVTNMLERRDRIQEILRQQLALPNESLKMTAKSLPPSEKAFLAKATGIVEQNIDNLEFDVTAFCDAIGMSRSNLYRKSKALTGLSIVEFIRTTRLKKAATLLKESTDKIEVIALQVGFSDVTYFNKCFKKQFGVSPGKY